MLFIIIIIIIIYECNNISLNGTVIILSCSRLLIYIHPFALINPFRALAASHINAMRTSNAPYTPVGIQFEREINHCDRVETTETNITLHKRRIKPEQYYYNTTLIYTVTYRYSGCENYAFFKIHKINTETSVRE